MTLHQFFADTSIWDLFVMLFTAFCLAVVIGSFGAKL